MADTMTECIVREILKVSCPIPEINWHLFVFIFVLLNDVVNVSDFITKNGRMVNE
jgi:hypothetical protein